MRPADDGPFPGPGTRNVSQSWPQKPESEGKKARGPSAARGGTRQAPECAGGHKSEAQRRPGRAMACGPLKY